MSEYVYTHRDVERRLQRRQQRGAEDLALAQGVAERAQPDVDQERALRVERLFSYHP